MVDIRSATGPSAASLVSPADRDRNTAEPIDAADVQGKIKGMLDEAVNWRMSNLDPAQAEATSYFRGQPIGNEVEGRSQVVMTTVRDTIRGIMPSLLRIFFSPDRTLEYRPRRPDQVAAAKILTEYIRSVVIEEDNDGLLVFLEWFQDALVRKLGIVKWWWDERVKVTGEDYSGLQQQEVDALLTEPGATDVEITESYQQGALPDGTPVPLFDVRIRREKKVCRARFRAVPPEEFLWSPAARTLEDADLVAHVRLVAGSELVEMGIDAEDVEDALGEVRRLDEQGTLAGVRRIDGGAQDYTDQADEMRRMVEYAEVYAYMDVDGDDRSELRLFRCLGPSRTVLGDGMGEPVSQRPFGLLCPDPEAHAFVGGSFADLTMDLQRINSAIMRGALDSLASYLNPAMEVVTADVEMQDVMNQEIGRVIRVRRPGVVREVTTEFVGAQALQTLDYMDNVRRDRTGLVKGSGTLDADALQSTTEVAVNAMVTAAEQQIEMVARIFAETGVRALYKGLLHLVAAHQDEERMVRLSGQWVPIDPRGFDLDLDVSVNVTLGNALIQDRIKTLAAIQQKQEQYLAQGIPFVSLVELRHTAASLIRLLGQPDPDSFFKPWGEQEEQAYMQQKAQQQPPPDPRLMDAQVRLQIAQLDLEGKKLQLGVRARSDAESNALETLRMLQDRELKAAQLEMQGHHDATRLEVEAARAERDRADRRNGGNQ